MKYDTEQALSEVLRRRSAQIIKREKRVTRGLSGTAAALAAALAVTVRGFSDFLPGEVDYSVYGAFRLPQSAGGYVLAGVITFCIGVVITLLCIRWQNRVKGPDPPDRSERGPAE